MKMLQPLVLALALACALAACTGPAPDTNTTGSMTSAGAIENTVVPPDETVPEETNETAPGPDETAYLGRWIGVEGMYLNVAKKSGGQPDGRVTLDMQWDLDNKGRFDGSVTAEVLRFVRNGITETLVPSDGDATGLKWLAGKTDCLTVKPGEGYCRDR